MDDNDHKKLWVFLRLLRRFGALHPPRLLGFYANVNFMSGHERAEFWPVHHAPELASAVPGIKDCRGGRLLAVCGDGFHALTRAVLMSPAGGKKQAILPPSPPVATCMVSLSRKILPDPADHGSIDDDDLQCLDLVVASKHGLPHEAVQVNELRQGVWSARFSLTTELIQSVIIPRLLLAGDRLYMTTREKIIVLNLTSSSFSVIDFPEPMGYNCYGGLLSKADDGSGIYLIKLVVEHDELLIRVWITRPITGSWVLVDTIRLRQIFADLGVKPGHRLYYSGCKVSCVGDNGKFLLLEMGDATVFYMDVPSRTMEAVFRAPTGVLISYMDLSGGTWPVMTIWPPSFPSVKQGQEHEQ
ncbi:hypothetical protein PR202_ga07269 [Eleusine coracana subsp. coracana]|uniref:F-box protein AT5G49610-like beta-propeller domain-containing protein n=1 Tax=Eleusine coracana subsp. coracana TaxID=191504 RepID=A0AAV5BZL6_ELECO|nr:hypothetical protein QOZ80_2AG0110160 [Eleusine coracana subsp. coracana]GJM90942.1 hypothetical protein PR202_ga07269 [Eleusine coracana subsp. coracana]